MPENRDYAPSRCCVNPEISAFDCPLDTCILDLPHGGAEYRRRLRAACARALRDEGYSVRRIAQKLGVSIRTAFRDLSGA